MLEPLSTVSRASLKDHLIVFAIPILWLAFVGLAGLLHQTTWGQEGHPSNSTILFIYALLGAPLFGLVGGACAWLCRRRYPKRARVAAVVLNAGVIAAGMWFWMFVGAR